MNRTAVQAGSGTPGSCGGWFSAVNEEQTKPSPTSVIVKGGGSIEVEIEGTFVSLTWEILNFFLDLLVVFGREAAMFFEGGNLPPQVEQGKNAGEFFLIDPKFSPGREGSGMVMSFDEATKRLSVIMKIRGVLFSPVNEGMLQALANFVVREIKKKLSEEEEFFSRKEVNFPVKLPPCLDLTSFLLLTEPTRGKKP